MLFIKTVTERVFRVLKAQQHPNCLYPNESFPNLHKSSYILTDCVSCDENRFAIIHQEEHLNAHLSLILFAEYYKSATYSNSSPWLLFERLALWKRNFQKFQGRSHEKEMLFF